jgi:hypothetical protein
MRFVGEGKKEFGRRGSAALPKLADTFDPTQKNSQACVGGGDGVQ